MKGSVHPGSVNKEVPPAGYVFLFLNHATGSGGTFYVLLHYPRRDPGIKTPKKDQQRQIYIEFTKTAKKKRRLRRQMYLVRP